MYVKFLFLMMVLTSSMPSPAFAQLPPVPEGYNSPPPITFDDLIGAIDKMKSNNCQTPDCLGFEEADSLIIMSRFGRKSAGTIYGDAGPPPEEYFYARKGHELDKEIRVHRSIAPEICKAITAIGARYDFKKESYSSVAAYSLDLARRLNGPGLDCFSQVFAAMPPSKIRDESVIEAYNYCAYSDELPLRCARLKQLLPDWYKLLLINNK